MADRTVVYRLQADIAGFEANMRNAAATTRKAADDMTAATKEGEKFRRGLTTVGDTAGKVGLVAAAGLGATIKAAVDWESAWAGVAKTVDGTAGQMAALESELRGLARTMPATHEEIAATAEAAGQLGVARQDITSFTKTMLELGETTNLTADEAATSIAQFMNVMKSSADDVDQIGNTLVDLGNKGASTEAQILDMAQRLSGAGALIGASESDVLALASAMSNLGIQSELGGGAIQRVFTNIYQSAADGAEGLQGFADVAGISAEQFADDWANDPVAAFDSFLQGLGRIKEGGGNVVGTLEDLGIKGTQNLQVMLRLAGAGDMLTTSLDQSNTAWEQNTALTDEYGKRAETTASQVQVAWNQIKDAGIEAGSVLLPAVAKAAGAVGDLATAFGNLPGPVKASATGLAGITAVFGGGLWFTAKTVNGIATMRKALDDLGIKADGAGGKLAGMAKAGAAGAAILTLAAAVTELSNSMAEALPGMDTLQGRLIDLASTPEGFSVSLGKEFDSLGDSIDRIAAPGRLDSVSDKLNSINDALLPGDQYADSAAREAVNEINALDEALAGLAAGGNADVASAALERVLGTLSDTQADYLLNQLPLYDEALAGVANQSKLTGAAASGASGDVSALGGAFGDAASEAEDFGDVVDRLNEKLSGRADLRSYQAAIDNFTEGLKENGRTFDINTEKGRANQANLDEIASSVLKVSENMKGAARQRFLTNAIDDLRTMGNNMGLPKSEINALIDLLRKANKTNVKPKIDVDASSAMSAIDRIRAALANIKDKSVTVRVTQTGAGVTPGFGPQANAEGGYITGPGTATSDSIPSYLSNGEYVVKAAAVQKYGVHMFDRLNAMHFADGGSVDKKRKKPRPVGGLFVEDTTDSLEEAIRRLTEVQEHQTSALERETGKLDEWSSKMSDVAQATVAGFSTGLFDKADTNPWSAGANGGGPLANLTKDIAGLQQRGAIQQQLASMGITGDALSMLLAQGSNSDLSALIASGQAQNAAALIGQRSALQASVGAAAGQQAYGAQYAAQAAELAKQTAAVVQTNNQLAGLQGQVAQLERSLAHAAEMASAAAGAAAGEAVRGQAVKGHRDKKNGG